MGGFGSGRGQGGKDTTSDMRALDIRRLQRDGLLTPGRAFGWNWLRNGETMASIQIRTEADRVILDYRSRSNGGEWQADGIPSTSGMDSLQPWRPAGVVSMSAQGCGRRVAILFGGSVFACRHCHKLAYQCQRETDYDRAVRRADTIRRRLGWEPGILEWRRAGKPKGMHWRTFERLKAEHDAFVNARWLGWRNGLD